MRRKIRRFFLLLLAFFFLLESWIWDVTGDVVTRFVAWLPLDGLKRVIGNIVGHLPPYVTLLVFAVPAVLLFPLKLVALWLIAEGKVLFGGSVIAFAQVVGFGILSFLFDVCRPQLNQIGWFMWCINRLAYWKKRASEYVRHYLRLLRRYGGPWQRVRRSIISKVRQRVRSKRKN